MMTIPKQRSYKLPIIAVVACLAVSSLLVVFSNVLAHGLVLPGWSRERKSEYSSERHDTERNDHQGKVVRQNDVAKRTEAIMPTQATPTQERQDVAPETTAALSTNSPVVAAQATVRPAETEPVRVDTAEQVRRLATAQTVRPSVSIEYPSARISSGEQKSLYVTSLAAGVVGVVAYMVSYASVAWQWSKRIIAPTRSAVATR